MDRRKAEAKPSAAALREEIARLEQHVAQAEERRRALIHIMGDLNESNRKLGEQRKAMLHILEDSHQSNQKLGDSRKAGVIGLEQPPRLLETQVQQMLVWRNTDCLLERPRKMRRRQTDFAGEELHRHIRVEIRFHQLEGATLGRCR